MDAVTSALDKVQSWVEARNYKGHEPFDGLSSPLRALTFGNLLCERLLQQAIRQAPINLRPLVGIPPLESTKGRGYMAWGYLTRFKATGQAAYRTKAEACLDWLDHHKARKFTDHSWSNHYDFSSRGGSYTKEDPIIVWTSLIGLAFVEAYELTQEERWLKIATSACEWVMKLPRERTGSGDCLSYLSFVQSSIHNSNMLGGALLARCGSIIGRRDCLEVARKAMEYSCSRQLEDGAWWYGEAPKYHWIDNFHTGYNLNCLDCYIKASGDEAYKSNLERGLAFYKQHFFEESGRPRYYHNRTYPVDIQCAAQAIETLSLFSDDPECRALAVKVAQWTIDNMQDRDGHFYYRKYPLMTAKTPMIHWGQATMFKALADLVLVLSGKKSVPAGVAA